MNRYIAIFTAFCTCALSAAAVGQTGTTERVSVDSIGAQADGASGDFAISADGRFVAFQSTATNLVAVDTNGQTDIFFHDRQTGTTELVSVDSLEAQSNGRSDEVVISANLRFVAFASIATNLVAADTNGSYDIFVRDRLLGTTMRVSVDSDGTQGDRHSWDMSISADGRFVAFSSDATNLVADDTNANRDIFIHDRDTDNDGIFDESGAVATPRVSVDSFGAQGNGRSDGLSISADGRFVEFSSSANLVAGDTNGAEDIFVHDRQTGTTERISVDSLGAQANGFSSDGNSISADGRFVAFESFASNLVAGDTNGTSDIFVRDRLLGTTTRVSVDSLGTQGNGRSEDFSISADGRFLGFQSLATNLVAGDTNGKKDVFVHDRQTGTTERVSVHSDGTPGNGGTEEVAFGAAGRFVAFGSDATNLVAGDTNGVADIFVHDRGPVTPEDQLAATTDDLQTIVDDNPGTAVADKVDDGISQLQTALAELEKNPPDAQAAMGTLEGAVGDLEAALGLDPALDAQIEGLIGQLVAVARQLATAAIQSAIDQGGDPTFIAEAQGFLAEGDTLRDAGSPKDAVAKYKDALAKAESAVG